MKTWIVVAIGVGALLLGFILGAKFGDKVLGSSAAQTDAAD